MKKRKYRFSWNSVRTKLILLVTLSYIVFTGILSFNSVQNIILSWDKFLELSETVMTLRSHNLDMMLAVNDEHLIFLSPMADTFSQSAAEPPESQTDATSYTRSRIHFLDEMKNARSQSGYIDGFFFYLPQTEEFLTAFSSNTAYAQRSDVKAGLIRCIAEQGRGTDRWLLRKEGSESFLCRILKVGEGYLGAWVSTDTLLKDLEETELAPISYITFLAEDHQILDSREFLQNPRELDLEAKRLSLDGVPYVLTQSQTKSGNFSLIGLVDEQSLLKGFESLYLSIVFFGLLLLVLIVSLVLLLRKSILFPLRSLAEAIQSIRQGNFRGVENTQRFDQEFQAVLETFNAMTEEIEKLKLTVYEEKIQRVKTKQQYYQLQINPHFLANSLNMIYQFAQIENYDLIKKMAMYLSAYFRYTLKNEAEWVSLGDELDHVKNYLKIQKIRYPYHLEAVVSMPPELEDVKIPPLTIQPFVENAIKYAVNADNVTNLSVTAERTELNGESQLLLRISDDGPGFPSHVLDALNRGERVEDPGPSGQKHLGVYNVQQRFLLFYENSAQIRFYNNQPHGAAVELTIPLEKGDGTC